MVGGLVRGYRDTWGATGTAGRRFLVGAAFYAIRLQAYMVAFPLYAKERGYDAGDIGFLTAGNWAALVAFGIPVTWLGSRGLARLQLAVGPLLSALGLLLIVGLPADALWPTFFATLLAGFSGATFWVLGDPLLAEATPAAGRARLFALKFFVLTVSTSLGGGLGGWIPAGIEPLAGATHETALATTLLLIAAFDLLQAAVFWSLPRRSRGARPAAAAPTAAVPAPGRTAGWWMWLLLLVIVMPEIGMAVGYNSVRPFLSLFLQEEQGLSAVATGTAIAAMLAAGGIGALILPSLAAQIGTVGTIASMRLAGATLVALWFAGGSAIAVIALMCCFSAVVDGTEATYVTDAMNRLPAARRTDFSGLYAILWSVASTIAATVSGQLQDRSGFGLAFAVGIGGYVFSAAWIGLVFPRLPRLTDGAEMTHGEPAAVADDPAVAVSGGGS